MGQDQDQGDDQALQDFLRRAVANSSSSSSTSLPIPGPYGYHDQGLDQNRGGGPLTFELEPNFGYVAGPVRGAGQKGTGVGPTNEHIMEDGDGVTTGLSRIRSNGARNFSGMSASTVASASGSGSVYKRKRRRAEESHPAPGRSRDIQDHGHQYYRSNPALDPDLNTNINLERGSETGETPRSRYSDEDEDEDSLEDQGTYEPTAPTPLPLSLPEPSDQGYRRYSRGTHSIPHHLDVDQPPSSNTHSHRKSTTTTTSNPNGTTATTTAKRRGRPALPPEERDERRRERARQSAAETRRKKRDVEGEREWWKEVEIEKAVLEEKYRTLVRDHTALKAQVASIPCLSLLNPHLAQLVSAPTYPLTGPDGPMLQLVLPLLLQTIGRGENGIDVNALIGLIQGQSRNQTRNEQMGTTAATSSMPAPGSSRVQEGTVEPSGLISNGSTENHSTTAVKRKSTEGRRDNIRPEDRLDDGSTSTDSAQSTPRVARRRVKRVRMDLEKQDDSADPHLDLDRRLPAGNDDAFNDGGHALHYDTAVLDENMGTPEASVNLNTTPTRSPGAPRNSILMSLRKRTQPSILPEPIPATPIDSDEDDGDFVPESELDDNGPTPRNERGGDDPASSPGTYNETPRTGIEGEEEDEDDDGFEFDPADEDFSQPIVDVAVPAWFGAAWAQSTSEESGEAIKEPAIGHEERDELVARLRAEIDKTPRGE